MRLKSQIWVSAYLRRCTALGIFAVVERRGDESAGAIFVKLVQSTGAVRLFAPAPQSAEGDGERLWMPAGKVEVMPEEEADAIIAREVRFDRDLWVVAVEDGAGRHMLDDRLLAAESIP